MTMGVIGSPYAPGLVNLSAARDAGVLRLHLREAWEPPALVNTAGRSWRQCAPFARSGQGRHGVEVGHDGRPGSEIGSNRLQRVSRIGHAQVLGHNELSLAPEGSI